MAQKRDSCRNVLFVITFICKGLPICRKHVSANCGIMFLRLTLQRFWISHYLQKIISSKVSENLQKSLPARNKAKTQCWMPVMFRPSVSTALKTWFCDGNQCVGSGRLPEITLSIMPHVNMLHKRPLFSGSEFISNGLRQNGKSCSLVRPFEIGIRKDGQKRGEGPSSLLSARSSKTSLMAWGTTDCS